jgi:hypothetical protein
MWPARRDPDQPFLHYGDDEHAVLAEDLTSGQTAGM